MHYNPIEPHPWQSNLILFYIQLGLVAEKNQTYGFHFISTISTVAAVSLFFQLRKLNQFVNIYKRLCWVIISTHIFLLPLKVTYATLVSQPSTESINRGILGWFGNDFPIINAMECTKLDRLANAHNSLLRPFLSPLYYFDPISNTSQMIPISQISFSHINTISENIVRWIVFNVTIISQKLFCLSPLAPTAIVTTLATFLWFYIFYAFIFENVDKSFVEETTLSIENDDIIDQHNPNDIDATTNNLKQHENGGIKKHHTPRTIGGHNNMTPQINKPLSNQAKELNMAGDTSDVVDENHQVDSEIVTTAAATTTPKTTRWFKQLGVKFFITFTLGSPLYVLFFSTIIHPLDFLYSLLIPGIFIWTDRFHLENLAHDSFINYFITHADQHDMFTISHDATDINGSFIGNVGNETIDIANMNNISGRVPQFTNHKAHSRTRAQFSSDPSLTPSLQGRNQPNYISAQGGEEDYTASRTLVKRPTVTSRQISGEHISPAIPVNIANARSPTRAKRNNTGKVSYDYDDDNDSDDVNINKKKNNSTIQTSKRMYPTGNYYHSSLLDHESDEEYGITTIPKRMPTRITMALPKIPTDAHNLPSSLPPNLAHKQLPQLPPAPPPNITPAPVSSRAPTKIVNAPNNNTTNNTNNNNKEPSFNQQPSRRRHVRSSTSIIGDVDVTQLPVSSPSRDDNDISLRQQRSSRRASVTRSRG